MKPLLVFALWAFVGWDVGAWAEAFAGIPAVVGIMGGVAIGAPLAIEARRQIAARAVRMPQLAGLASVDAEPTLDRAA